MKIRKIVISLLMSLALLLSSVSVPVSAYEPVYMTNEASVLHSPPLHQAECPKTDHENNAISHHCCASFCLLKMPFSQAISVTNPIAASLALIGEDEFAKAVSRIQTLFRPPIA